MSRPGRRHEPEFDLPLIDHLRRVAASGGLRQSNRNSRGAIHNWTAAALEKRGWVTVRLETYGGAGGYWYYQVRITAEGRQELGK